MKCLPNEDHIDLKARDEKRPAYDAPTIIYEGIISTRAGSPLFGQDGDEGVDPADLFGE